jgi:hypothetical protein
VSWHSGGERRVFHRTDQGRGLARQVANREDCEQPADTPIRDEKQNQQEPGAQLEEEHAAHPVSAKRSVLRGGPRFAVDQADAGSRRRIPPAGHAASGAAGTSGMADKAVLRRRAKRPPLVRCSVRANRHLGRPFWPGTRVVTPAPFTLARLIVPAPWMVQSMGDCLPPEEMPDEAPGRLRFTQ